MVTILWRLQKNELECLNAFFGLLFRKISFFKDFEQFWSGWWTILRWISFFTEHLYDILTDSYHLNLLLSNCQLSINWIKQGTRNKCQYVLHVYFSVHLQDYLHKGMNNSAKLMIQCSVKKLSDHTSNTF